MIAILQDLWQVIKYLSNQNVFYNAMDTILQEEDDQ